MKYTTLQPASGYSIILSLVMIGFLLVLTTGTLNLVLQEMQDGRGKQDYLKSYAGAEGALELALLKIKEEGYGYYDSVTDAQILGNTLKDVQISYQFEGKVSSYSGSLQANETHIIPLFWINTENLFSFANQINFLSSTDLNWNIVTNDGGISGIGSFGPNTTTGEKKLESIAGNIDFTFTENIKIQDFLNSSTGAYLMVYNPYDIAQNYTVSSGLGFFTEPKSIIRSSAKVGKYTQNLETLVDNTEFLGILKYSIYSGN